MKPRILISGMIAGSPRQGGATWAVLQYLLGFRRLGYEVCFVEPIQALAIQPADASLAASANADYFKRVMKAFDFQDHAALLMAGSTETFGLAYEQLRQQAAHSDVLINISGMLQDEALIAHIPVRVYLDLDPAFIQLWSAVQGINMRFDGHTHFVTIGSAIGMPDCTVPTCGRNWLTTLQPIALEHWPVTEPPLQGSFTTVGNWRGYGSIEHNGVFYGQKAHSLRPLYPLPALTQESFELALAIHPGETKDLAALAEHGWKLVDPACVAHTPSAYQHFIHASKAEYGIAKSGYVLSRCGWFSDRSVCYLASGRPVLAQDTGFDRFLPTGEGLFSFRTIDDVLAAIAALRADYPRHARKARALAEEYFNSDRVLKQLLAKVGGPPP